MAKTKPIKILIIFWHSKWKCHIFSVTHHSITKFQIDTHTKLDMIIPVDVVTFANPCKNSKAAAIDEVKQKPKFKIIQRDVLRYAVSAEISRLLPLCCCRCWCLTFRAYSFSSFTQPHEDRVYNLKRSVFVGLFTSGSCALSELIWAVLDKCASVSETACAYFSLKRFFIYFGSRSRKVLLYYICTDFTVSVYRLNEYENYYCVLKCGHSILFFLFTSLASSSRSSQFDRSFVFLRLFYCSLTGTVVQIRLKKNYFGFISLSLAWCIIHNRQFVISVYFFLFFYSVSLGCVNEIVLSTESVRNFYRNAVAKNKPLIGHWMKPSSLFGTNTIHLIQLCGLCHFFSSPNLRRTLSTIWNRKAHNITNNQFMSPEILFLKWKMWYLDFFVDVCRWRWRRNNSDDDPNELVVKQQLPTTLTSPFTVNASQQSLEL